MPDSSSECMGLVLWIFAWNGIIRADLYFEKKKKFYFLYFLECGWPLVMYGTRRGMQYQELGQYQHCCISSGTSSTIFIGTVTTTVLVPKHHLHQMSIKSRYQRWTEVLYDVLLHFKFFIKKNQFAYRLLFSGFFFFYFFIIFGPKNNSPNLTFSCFVGQNVLIQIQDCFMQGVKGQWRTGST